MLTANHAIGPAAALATERRALLAGQQLAVVERFLPLLRRSNFDVRRTLRATGTIRLVQEVPFELVVVVLPFPELRELLGAVRDPASPSRNAAVLLVAEEAEPQVRDELLIRLANRVLPARTSDEEIDKALSLLLDVAPRVPMRGAVRVRLSAQQTEPRVLRLENLSASGMLLAGQEPLPVGSVFGFELELPEQKAPIRGQATVVRHATIPRPGEQGLGVRFVSVGGEGVERLESAILRERAAAGARQWIDGAPPAAAAATAGATTTRSGAGVVAVRSEEELARLREELAELAPYVDDLLRHGLARRLGVADWYVTGVELGLESLGAFAGILETVYRGHGGPPESSRHIADLADVRRQLAEFAKPHTTLPARVEILVGIRPALERLLRELAESGDQRGTGGRQRGVVSQLVLDVQRVMRARTSLDKLQDLLIELHQPRYLIARGALRRRAEAICQQYRGYAGSLGLDRPETLMSRRGRREALALAQREARRTDDWLGAIHKKVYPARLRQIATGRFATDFAEDRLFPVVAQVLSAGYDYLVRAYSAYRHALEMSGADAGLLERVAGLAASVAAAERRTAR